MIATLEKTNSAESVAASRVVASLEGVSKSYGDVRALKGVNFRVRAGEVVALLGPNGAGKTTAVKLLLGLLQPNAGRVRVLGGDPTNPENRMRTGAMLQVGRVQRRCGYVSTLICSPPTTRIRCPPRPFWQPLAWKN